MRVALKTICNQQLHHHDITSYEIYIQSLVSCSHLPLLVALYAYNSAQSATTCLRQFCSVLLPIKLISTLHFPCTLARLTAYNHVGTYPSKEVGSYNSRRLYSSSASVATWHCALFAHSFHNTIIFPVLVCGPLTPYDIHTAILCRFFVTIAWQILNMCTEEWDSGYGECLRKHWLCKIRHCC